MAGPGLAPGWAEAGGFNGAIHWPALLLRGTLQHVPLVGAGRYGHAGGSEYFAARSRSLAAYRLACSACARNRRASAGGPGLSDLLEGIGKLRGKQSRLKPAQDREIRRMHDSGDYNIVQIAALFSTSRPTVYRSLDRTAELPPLSAGTWPVPDVTRYDQLLTRNPGQQ